MAKESFLMVSLEEDKAKKLANVISNDKCRMILDYLTDNESVTETEIAKALKLPLSTVHYNVQQLLANDLITSEEYHYSEKGKEVQHYSLAQKYIIISPKPIRGIKTKLKEILPVVLLVGAAAAVIRMTSSFIGPGKAMFRKAEVASFASDAGPMAQQKAMEAGAEIARDNAAQAGAEIAQHAVADAAPRAAEELVEAAPQAVNEVIEAAPGTAGDALARGAEVTAQAPDINIMIVWFVVGALFALGAYVILDLIRKRKTKNQNKTRKRLSK